MKRIECTDNTEALVKMMEMASDVECMVILYEKKEEAGGGTGFVHIGEATLAELNWVIDRFKLWLHGPLRKEDE
jgi:hypothetical protein